MQLLETNAMVGEDIRTRAADNFTTIGDLKV